MTEIYCKDCEHFDKCVRGYMPDCPVYYPKKGIMTNEEWIKSCTTEQLADALMKIFAARTFCHLCPEGDVCDIGYKCKYSDGKKIEDWMKWLKKPHKE